MDGDDEVFAAIAHERRKLADYLDGLTAQQWQVRSLCTEWTCRDVAAHLVMPLVTSTPVFAWQMLKALGNFNRANLALTAATAQRFEGRLPSELRERAESRFTPPGFGPLAPLTDLIVHGLDIRVPLAGSDAPAWQPTDPKLLVTVLDFLTEPAAAKSFGTGAHGVGLVATDVSWWHGSGPAVEGTAEEIILVMTGRAGAATGLTGDGVASLR